MSMEGREDGNWETAMSNHREIQAEIIHRRNLELFDDVESLLPGGCMPDCVEQRQETDPWVPEDKLGGRKRKSRAKAKEPATKRARGAPVPEGAMEGFIAASKLTKQSKKSAARQRAALSDTSDEDLPDVTAALNATDDSRKSDRSEARSSTSGKARYSTKHASDVGEPSTAANKKAPRKTKQAPIVEPSSPIMPSSPILRPMHAGHDLATEIWEEPPTAQSVAKSSRLHGSNSSAWILDVEDDEYPMRGPKATVPSMGAPATEESPVVVRRRPLRNVIPSSDSNAAPAIRVGLPLAPMQNGANGSPLRQSHKAKHADRIDPRTFLEIEAGVSDPSENEDDDSSGEEDETDRRFAGHFQPTQAPKGYNQHRAYLAGLSTQRAKGDPAFANRGPEKAAFLAKARRPVLLSQEPVGDPSSGYAETDDSFVVDDDVPIAYDTDASSDA